MLNELTRLFVEVFGVEGHLTVAQECARAAAVVACGLFLVRCAGRRVFGKWAALDIVIAIVVSSNLSRALTGNAPFIGTLIATALMIALHWLLAHLSARYSFWSFLTEGRTVRLGTHGSLQIKTLYRHGVTGNDIAEVLRQSATSDVGEVEAMFLEPSGKIVIVKRRASKLMRRSDASHPSAETWRNRRRMVNGSSNRSGALAVCLYHRTSYHPGGILDRPRQLPDGRRGAMALNQTAGVH
jgi:uncharacterized membrane protein YcaP (DUF421 family)